MPSLTLAPKEVNWSKDPIWAEIVSDHVSGGEAQQPNLSCYVQVEVNGQFLTEFNAPYALHNGRTDFDLSGLDIVRQIAPPDNAIGVYHTNTLDGNTARVRLKFGDMFGTPAEKPSFLVLSSEFTMIHGHTPYWYGIGALGEDVILHSYLTPNGRLAIKELRKNQDEFIYIYSHTGNPINIYGTIIYTDGTSVDGPVVAFTAGQYGITYVNAGWNMMNMDAIKDPAKTVQTYVVYIQINGEYQPIHFTLDDHDTDYDEYILYDNGMGGCEVLRCSGRHVIKVEANKEFIQRSRFRGSNFRDGFEAAYNISGSEVWEMNTGYQNQEYIRHLAQLLMTGKAWYIDRIRGKFTNVTIRTGSANLIDYENDLYSLTFTMKFDDRPSLGTLNI